METFTHTRYIQKISRANLNTTNKLYNTIINLPSSPILNIKNNGWCSNSNSKKKFLKAKKKNRLIIKNQNLVDRSLKFAEKLKYIKHIILTTDDSFFINRKYKSSIIKINRPKYLAKKILHLLQQ